MHNAVRANVSRTVNRLRTTAELIVLDPIRSGKLRIVGVAYNVDDGDVDFFDEG